MILKQNTAYPRKFRMALSSDHISGATAKTVTAKISKGTGAAGTTPAGTISELDATNLPGVYQIAFTAIDTNTLGDLWVTCTAADCDPTNFCDQVEVQVFTDLSLNATGQALIASSIKQGVALNGFTFMMTAAGTNFPMPDLTVTAQRSLNGAGFAPCVNAPTEIGNGFYAINLAAADLNASVVALHFTATSANDTDLVLMTQP